MGHHINESEDAMAFVPLYDRYINQYLAGDADYQALADELLSAMVQHGGSFLDNRLWGWKNPRSIYLLPILDALIPGLRFVHVVRDGMAMSTSDNQAQLTKHGAYVIEESMQSLPQNQRSLLLWSLVNNAGADYGKSMGNRYFVVRYEDVCENPSKAFSALGISLGLDLPMVWDAPIQKPRMRQAPMSLEFNKFVIEIASNTFKRFGYPC